jgi:hypothetical protein
MSTELNNSASQPSPTLRQFFDQKHPATIEDRILVIAYYLEKFRGESYFDYHRIDDCLGELDLTRSSRQKIKDWCVTWSENDHLGCIA